MSGVKRGQSAAGASSQDVSKRMQQPARRECSDKHMQHGSACSASYIKSSRCVAPHVRHNSPRAKHERKITRGKR
eukprot:12322177-Alexandrium_andersonii.AAC.1